MYRSAWVRIRSASKSCANIKLRRPRERSRVRAPRRTNPSRSAPHVERTPPRSTCRGALDRFAWRTAAFTHRFARARSRGARSRGLRALASPELGANKDYEPLGADEYVEEQGRRDVDAFGATTLAPAVSSDAAAASPAPYASPSLADTDLASRSLVETYPPEVMLSVDDPAYSSGDWLLGRATYFDAPAAWKTTFSSQIFGDLHGNGCGYVDKGPGEESNADFPFPSTPSPRWPTSTLGSTKLPAEAATRFDASPVQSSGTTTRRRFGIRANLLVFSRLTPTPGTRRVEKTPRTKRREISRLERRVRVRALLERHREHLRHHRGRVPVFVLMGETTRVLRSDPALRPEFLGRGAFGASRPGKNRCFAFGRWTARRENR